MNFLQKLNNNEHHYRKNNKELIHRLNRAIGQIEAIKRDLSENQKIKIVLKLLISLKLVLMLWKNLVKLMTEHLDECFEQGNKDEISKNLKPILNGIFNL